MKREGGAEKERCKESERRGEDRDGEREQCKEIDRERGCGQRERGGCRKGGYKERGEERGV